MDDRSALSRLAGQRDLHDILLEHALRGLRIQVLLRIVLALFVVLVVVIEPPANDAAACYLIAALYAVWAGAGLLVVGHGGEGTARFAWLALFVDLIAIGTLTVVASDSDQQSWTADILVNGLILIPLLAATQLRPMVCALVAGPTVLVYLGASAAARQANTEPWASVLLRTLVVAGLAAGCVLLSRVQRSRVLTIGALATDRARLLSEVMQIEERNRRELAENLHDGVLQYLLAARQDLEEAQGSGDDESFERVEWALTESSRLLRSTMTELHPAVLKQAGLPSALRELAQTIGSRGGIEVTVDTSEWPITQDPAVDAVLFTAARELLTNVVKHARATRASVAIAAEEGSARLEVTDDGQGVQSAQLAQSLADGHIGVASQRARIEALGGRFTLRPADSRGTIAEVEIPLPPR
ncbi:two-component system NarL family sensor kinase [Jatrophihabitans sp. GAS493]|uniref:sensor histidine kinase n=1 Tax=Jatrophihabitans sp. GAS493 TaxID=1907575 RepID=UPI000BB94D1F|nr:ATP-binding protein [Jatrophihabitans sp. GAS493]SOD74886.1 two-component system NarL family sensor kinase [Jatrophihabitans sp. GAS493]